MSKSTAWDIASVSLDARRLAERAAGRAGVTVEQWLDRAIAEHASESEALGSRDELLLGSARDGSRDRRLADGAISIPHEPPRSRLEGASARDLQERLRANAEKVERRVPRSEEIAAKALELIETLLQRREAVGASPMPADPLTAAKSTVAARAPESSGPRSESLESGSGGPNVKDAAARTPQPREAAQEPRPLREPFGPTGAFDLKSAVSEIASRRRALDARKALDGLEPPRDHEGAQASDADRFPAPLAPPVANLDLGSIGKPADAPPPAGRTGETLAAAAPTGVSDSPSDALRLDLRTLSGKMEALRREWSATRASDRDLSSLQDQMTAVRRSLTGLAPREMVAALEESLGALAQRVSALNLEERDQLLLAALDRVADQLRDALSLHDPKLAAVDVERRVDSLVARIDELAGAMVRPEVIEAVRQQMEEVHDLLLTAARRSIPIERLEDQIARLVEQVERLAASASLAALQPPAGDVTASPVLASIDQRLAEISTRLDRDAAELSSGRPDLDEFDLATQSAEASLWQSQAAADRVEASLNAFAAKLEVAGVEPLAALIRDLNDRLEAAEIRDRARPQVEPLLSEIAERLDRVAAPDREQETSPLQSIEQELKAIRASVEAAPAPTLDREAADRFVESVARRLEGHLAGQATLEAVDDQLATLNGRLDAVASRLGEAGALERTTRDLLEKLQEAERAGEPAETGSDVAEQINAFRLERAAAERRTETLLQTMQDILDRLIDRLPGDEAKRSPSSRRPDGDGDRRLGARPIDPSPLSELDDIAPRAVLLQRASHPGEEAGPSSNEPEHEFLLEPGAGAPNPMQSVADLANAIGPRTNPAVSAHIAAARRAAQSAVAESKGAASSSAWPGLGRRVRGARQFTVRHKRSLLLAAALILAATVAVRMIAVHGSFTQRSDLAAPAAKVASAEAPPRAAGPGAVASKAAPAAVDTAPIGSINPARANVGGEAGPTPPDLSAAIPTGVAPTLREAVLSGSPAAQYDLAQQLFEGRALPQDQAKAAFWFARAASAGYPPAEFRLGALYQKGVGVGRDPAAAKRWYQAAAEAGNARAAHNLGVINAEPVGEKADYGEAAKWFRRAAELGVRDSQYNLAVLYARGLGVDQDLRQSWLWFSLAAAQGDAEAAKKRDEVAEKMDPDARAAAAQLLSKVKVGAPDPAANDPDASSAGGPDKAQPERAKPAAASSDEGAHSGL